MKKPTEVVTTENAKYGVTYPLKVGMINEFILEEEQLYKISLKTTSGEIIANESYIAKLQDGTEIKGKTDEKGLAEIEVDEDILKITFPELNKQDWDWQNEQISIEKQQGE